MSGIDGYTHCYYGRANPAKQSRSMTVPWTTLDRERMDRLTHLPHNLWWQDKHTDKRASRATLKNIWTRPCMIQDKTKLLNDGSFHCDMSSQAQTNSCVSAKQRRCVATIVKTPICIAHTCAWTHVCTRRQYACMRTQVQCAFQAWVDLALNADIWYYNF